jgi:demethylmenaquinone methyltransferase/2-methoxy-6-polyprenyl-1,4-benzoquinol methylase
MLGIFTRDIGNCWHFIQCPRDQGLQVSEQSRFFGCATSVRGTKPPAEDKPTRI